MPPDSVMVRTYCPACYTYYYSCPGCHCEVCDCGSNKCLCPEDNIIGLVNNYLQDYEIPEAIKEKTDD